MNRWLPVVMSGFALMLACGCGQNERVFYSINLGGGKVEARALDIAGPAAFARQEVRFYFTFDSGQRLLASTWIANDGARLGEANVVAATLDSGDLLLILKGQEQRDERWLLRTNTRMQMTKLDQEQAGTNR